MKSLPLIVVVLLMAGCGGPVKRCLVSPLSGTIVTNGTPVAGATVTRKYHSDWYNKDVVTVTHTDDKGSFSFDGAWKKAAVDVLHQPVIHEEVIVEYNGTNQTVMDLTKMDYDSFGEVWAAGMQDPEHGKERLIKKDGKLYFKFDLSLEKVPIGRRSQ